MGWVAQPPDQYVPAPPDAVWDVLVDLDAYDEWSDAFTVRGLGGSHVGHPVEGMRFLVVARVPFPFTSPVPCRFATVEPHRRLAWTAGGPGLRLRHSFDLRADGDGTVVQHVEAFDGPGAMLLRPLQPRFEAAYRAWNEQLAARVDAAATAG